MKNKFIKGMAIGAVVGGFITLFDRETRNDVWNTLKNTQSKTRNLVKNPTEAFQIIHQGYMQISDEVSNGVTGALDILEKVQGTLDSLSNLDEDDDKKIKLIDGYKEVN